MSESKKPKIAAIVSEETKEALEEEAKKQKRTLSNLVSAICEEYLENKSTTEKK